MAYNKEMKNMIEKMMKSKNCNDFEIEVMCNTVEHLYKLYGDELNDAKVLMNIQRIEKVTAIDKDEDVDYAGCMRMIDDKKCEVFYKNYEDKEYIRSVLTHEFIHALSNKVYDKEYITGIKELERDRALNESLTESFTENVLKSQGIDRDFGTASYYDINDNTTYVYPLTSDSYTKVTPYGNLLIEIDKSDFARNYFTEVDEDFLDTLNAVSKNMRYVLYKENDSNDIRYDKNYIDEYDLLNKSFCKLLSKDNDFKSSENNFLTGILNDKDINTSRYFYLMDKVKDLPGMSKENIRYLEYNKFSDRSNVNLDDYLNKNSDFNKSLDVLEVVRENFKNKNIDIDNIEFCTITNRRDDSQKIIFSIGGGKKYSFNREDVINNDFKIVEYKEDINLNKKIFNNEKYSVIDNIKDGTIVNDFVDNVKDKIKEHTRVLDGSNYDFEEFVKISNKSNWLEQIDNDFKGSDKIAFNFIKNDKIDIDKLISSKDFEDKNGNNIMHLLAYKNYSGSNINSFSYIFSQMDSVDGFGRFKEKEMREVFRELLTEKNKEGLTPFDEAVQNDNKDSILFLSKIIDEYNIEDYSSGTVKAVINNDCFKELLEDAKKNDNYSVVVKMAKSFQNDSEFDVKNFLNIAVDKEITSNKFWSKIDIEDINYVFKNNGNFINIITNGSDIDYKVIKNILSRDGVNVNEVSYSNRTPLHNMLLNGGNDNGEKNKIIDKLIDRGADVNAECKIGETILKKSTGLPVGKEDFKFHPVYGSRLKLSEDEIERIPSTVTALQIASGIYKESCKDYNSVDKLVKAGADIKKETEKYISPLEAAHIDGDIKMFKIFIENGYSTKELFEGYSNTKLTENMKESLIQYEEEVKNEQKEKTENKFNNLFKNDKENDNDSVFDKFKNIFDLDKNDDNKIDIVENGKEKLGNIFDKDKDGDIDIWEKIKYSFSKDDNDKSNSDLEIE